MKIFILLQKLSTLNSQLSTFFATFALGNRLESARYALPLPFKPLERREKYGKERFEDSIHGYSRVCSGNAPCAR